MGKEISKKKIGKNLLMGALLAGSVMIPMYNVNAAETPTITYQAHVENYGWMKEVSTSDKDSYAGTQGQALRMEALKIKVEGLDNVTLSYKAHIENIGDKEFDSKSEIIGTEGQALRLEAITVNADGLEDTGYSLQYRVHIENEGTSNWVNAGEEAGSRGKAQRLESIEFRLLSETEKQLADAKANAIAELEKDYPAEKYTINARAYNDEMAKQKAEIENAKSFTAVMTALSNAKTALDDIPSDEDEATDLSENKRVSITKYETIYDLYKADAGLKDTALNADQAARNIIYSATTATAAENAADDAIASLNNSVTNTVLTEIESLYKNGKSISGVVKYLSKTDYDAIKEAVEALRKITKSDEVATAVSALITAYGTQNMETEEELVASIKTSFTTYVGTMNATIKADAKVKAAIDNTNTSFITATTRAQAEQVDKTGRADVHSAMKEYVTNEINKYYGKADNKQTLSAEKYVELTTALRKANDIVSIEKVNTDISASLTDNSAWVKLYEDTLDAYVAVFATAGFDTTDAEAAKIVTDAKANFAKLATKTEMATAEKNAEIAYLAAVRNSYIKKLNDLVKNGMNVTTGGKNYVYTNTILTAARNTINGTEDATVMAQAITDAQAKALVA